MRSGSTTNDPEVDFVALPAGEMIGRYEVLAVLGQGGFGITYLARDIQLDREVAIKEYLPVSLAIRQDGHTVLPRSTKVAEDFTWGRDRFVAEGRTLATLHRAPGIVRVFDFLEINGTAYIVMEMLHGETLEARLKRLGALDPAAIDLVLWTLLDGLEEVHNAGFLHRDIKPGNILLDGKGNPTLIDFGASRAAMVGRTVAMTAIFTPGYAAAEQFTSAKQGPWTDIYGLAATLYHAISGTAPPSAFDRMLEDSYEPISQRAAPGLAAGLLAGIDAGLAVRAADRPQSIAGWRTLLSWTPAPGDDATVLSGRARPHPVVPAPRPTSAPAPLAAGPIAEHPPRTAPRSRAVLYAGVAAAALALAGGGYFAFAPGSKPAPSGVALQDLKVEDLERVLAERRKADAAAAEKKRLEEEAQRKAEADAAAKKTADSELEKAQQARLKAEAELAQMKADAEARQRAQAGQKEQADAAARRAAEEAAQRKAEAEMAALKQAEEEAKRKAESEAEAKRQADDALATAQIERQKADAEAKLRADAESRQKAEASTRQVAEAEARQQAAAAAKAKADADAKAQADVDAAAAADKKAAEGAEAALRLTLPDRQRVQVALTALGYDTRGYDGAFGPRSREMITSWQKSRNLPATGFLSGAHNQALLKDAAPAIAKFDDDQKKIEDDKKKAEDERKRVDEEAKARTAAAAATATAPVAPPPPSSAAIAPAPAASAPPSTSPGGDVRWIGQVKCGLWNNPVAVAVPVSNGQGSSTIRGGPKGFVTVTISITGNRYSGSVSWSPPSNAAKTLTASFSGTISGSTITASPYARSDFKGGPGPDDVACAIELSRTQ